MTLMSAPIATLEDLRGRHALVLGLARSGTAVARLLADAGAEVAAYDRRPRQGRWRDQLFHPDCHERCRMA